MSDIGDFYPEMAPCRAGDPFLLEIVRLDDLLSDLEDYGPQYLNANPDMPDVERRRLVASVSAEQLAYELAALARWWRL